MSYLIEVEAEAAKRLRALPPEVRPAVVEQIDRLGHNPTLGVKLSDGVLAGRMLYAFIVECNPRVLRLTEPTAAVKRSLGSARGWGWFGARVVRSHALRSPAS